MKDSDREITITLSKDLSRYTYSVKVDGKEACAGSCATALNAYQSAVGQLAKNEDCFPIDCPDPFMGESKLDRWLTAEIDAGRRPA